MEITKFKKYVQNFIFSWGCIRSVNCDRLCPLPDQQGERYGGSIADYEPVPVHPAVPGHHQPGCWGAVCRGRHRGPIFPAAIHRLLPGKHVDGQVSSHHVVPFTDEHSVSFQPVLSVWTELFWGISVFLVLCGAQKDQGLWKLLWIPK